MESMIQLVTKHKGTFFDRSGKLAFNQSLLLIFILCCFLVGKKLVAYYESQDATIRHISCLWLFDLTK